MKTLVVVILVYVNSVSGDSVFGCMNIESFNKENQKFFSEDIQNYMEKHRLSLIDAVIGKSTLIGKGSFGKVVSIKSQKPPLALKILNPKTDANIKTVKEEITMLTKVCQEKFDEKSTKLINCEGKEIAAFKGCVEYKEPISDQYLVLIFQRQAYGTMEVSSIYSKYRKQPAIKRAVMMMRILEKVASLHNKGIVHSDIKPENVVIVKSDMKEFELIDLGMARDNNSKFVGGTPLYYSPEYWNGQDTLIRELDVYSIAMTLLNLESNFSEAVTNILTECFKLRYKNQKLKYTEDCHKKVLSVVPKAFHQNNSPSVLAEVFKQALAYNIKERYSSALEFLVDIVDKLYLIPEYQGYIYGLIKRYTSKKEEDKVNQSLGKGLSSTLRWEEIAISLGYDTEPPGLIARASKYVICGNNKVTPKPPARKKKEDMPEYLIPILKKKDEVNIVAAKLGIKSEIPTSDKIKIEFPLVEEENKCTPCVTDDDDDDDDDDDAEVGEEGEHQTINPELPKNKQLNSPFNVRVLGNQLPPEIDQEINQQII